MKKKITPSRVLFNVLNYSFFAAFLILCAYPMWYVLIYTISDPAVLKNQTVTFLPRGFSQRAEQRRLAEIAPVGRIGGYAGAFQRVQLQYPQPDVQLRAEPLGVVQLKLRLKRGLDKIRLHLRTGLHRGIQQI